MNIKNFSGKGTINYTKGAAVYEGEVLNSKPHGIGKMTYKDGRVCEGIWEEGEFVYEGELNENGKPHGRGKWMSRLWTYEEDYEGEWKDGKKHGKGICKGSDGSVEYDGEWKDDKWHGKGTRNYDDGDVYKGEWRAGKQHGRGVMTHKNGDIYDGEWKEDLKDGHGKLTYHNGDVYEGEFSNDEMHGKGTYTYATGNLSKSIGVWKDGKKCGEFEDIVRFSKRVIYEDGEVKEDSNVKREAQFDVDTDTEGAPPSKRRNVCVSPPQPQV